MKTIVLAVVAVAAVSPVAAAEASNRSVARERMTVQLFAEWGPESSSPSVTYKAVEDPASGLVFLEEVATPEGSYQSWRPAWLRVSCHHNRCVGRLFANNEAEPKSETYVALEDHATFRGRKGTYHETGWEPPS
jgi:hypothetical protein